MAGRRYFARVVACAGPTVTVDREFPDGVLAGGRLRWFGGEQAGLESGIVQPLRSGARLAGGAATRPAARRVGGDRRDIEPGGAGGGVRVGREGDRAGRADAG